MMKKTLVALALAATTVSGSAMAWTAGGTGGSLELGGTLTPPAMNTNPWEVLVGPAVADLSAPINVGDTIVNIPLTKAITVLGIRTQTNQAFKGKVGLSPQINYNGAYDTATQAQNQGMLTVQVLNKKDNSVIGSLKVPMLAGALGSYKDINGNSKQQRALYAATAGQGFFGGLATKPAAVDNNIAAALNTINPEFSAKYNTQTATMSQTPAPENFSSTTATFSGYYGSGIQVGQSLKLTLTTPAASDAIPWKASLPITVAYQ